MDSVYCFSWLFVLAILDVNYLFLNFLLGLDLCREYDRRDRREKGWNMRFTFVSRWFIPLLYIRVYQANGKIGEIEQAIG
jgi:hypothetical protein